jgi:hypothetical protein
MVPWLDYMFYTALAEAFDCVVWWHIFPDGDYRPYLMPLHSTPKGQPN